MWFVEKKGIDDPVGAISVHGVCGMWGVLAVGLFSDGTLRWGLERHQRHGRQATDNIWGLFYGHGGGGQLVAQIIGVLTIAIVMGGIAFAFFKIQNALTKGGIRPTAEVELQGVDLPEMGVLAYPSFFGSSPHVEAEAGNGHTPMPEPVPVGQEHSR